MPPSTECSPWRCRRGVQRDRGGDRRRDGQLGAAPRHRGRGVGRHGPDQFGPAQHPGAGVLDRLERAILRPNAHGLCVFDRRLQAPARQPGQFGRGEHHDQILDRVRRREALRGRYPARRCSAPGPAACAGPAAESGSTRKPSASGLGRIQRCPCGPLETGSSTAVSGAAPRTRIQEPVSDHSPASPGTLTCAPTPGTLTCAPTMKSTARPHGNCSSSRPAVIRLARAVASTGRRPDRARPARPARRDRRPSRPPRRNPRPRRPGRCRRSAEAGQYARQKALGSVRIVAIGRTDPAHPRIDSWTALCSSVWRWSHSVPPSRVTPTLEHV